MWSKFLLFLQAIDAYTWTSIITALAAIIALFQTSSQIRQSNKQHLFDRRLNNYMKIKDLISLYDSSKHLLVNNNYELLNVDMEFLLLTNSSYLEKISNIIKETKNSELKKQFLMKLEELEKIAYESELLFSKKYGKLLSVFTINYKNVLMELYKYQIMIDNIEESHIQNQKKELKDLCINFNENSYRTNLIKTYDELKDSYMKLESKQIMKKVKKYINYN